MATTGSTIVYELLELVDAAPGGWCEKCMLPSGVEITLASQVRGGPLKLTTRRRCQDCGRTVD